MITPVDTRRKPRFTVEQIVGAHISRFERCGTHICCWFRRLNRGICFWSARLERSYLLIGFNHLYRGRRGEFGFAFMPIGSLLIGIGQR